MIRRQHDSFALTPREQQVLGAVVAGDSTSEIAIAFGISARTVEIHRGRCLNKLGARNTADLVRMAIVSGLVDVGAPTAVSS